MNIQAKPITFTTKRGTPVKRFTFEWSELNIARAAKLWKEGYTSSAIAAVMGTSKGSVTSIASQHRDRFPTRLTKGKRTEDGRHVEIPDDWLNWAIELWMSGKNANQIANITGVRGSTAYTRITTRKELFPEHRLHSPARSERNETRLSDSTVIRHVKRTHITGEVHTMPRISMIDGKEA